MNRVAYWRGKKGLTVRELAEKSGLSPKGINNIETGLTDPYGSTLGKLAIALGVESEELIEPEGEIIQDVRTAIGVAAQRRERGAKDYLYEGQLDRWKTLQRKLQKQPFFGYHPILEKADQTLSQMVEWAGQPDNVVDKEGAEVWRQVAEELTTHIRTYYPNLH